MDMTFWKTESDFRRKVDPPPTKPRHALAFRAISKRAMSDKISHKYKTKPRGRFRPGDLRTCEIKHDSRSPTRGRAGGWAGGCVNAEPYGSITRYNVRTSAGPGPQGTPDSQTVPDGSGRRVGFREKIRRGRFTCLSKPGTVTGYRGSIILLDQRIDRT